MEKERMKYKCGYCKNEFEQEVSRYHGVSDKGRSNVSSQVRCPRCGNGLKTWK